MWVGDACPVSRMKRIVLACQTESQVLGIDCQCGIPRSAARPISTAPSRTPAATTSAGPRDHRARLGVDVAVAGRAATRKPSGDAGHEHQSKQRGPGVPRDAKRAERNDRQRHDAVGQGGADRDSGRPS